jgi:membrane protein EpsK
LQWSTVIQGLAALLAGVCAPLIVILYSREQKERLVSVARFAVKTMALLIAIPAGLFCGFSKPLLVLWLGAAFEPQARLLILTMLPMVVVSSVTPLYAVQIAYNKLRFPATAMVVIGLVKFPLVIALCMTKHLDLNGLCLIGGLIWVIKCVYTNLLYNAKILKVPSMTFVTPVIWGVLLQAGVWTMAYLCSVIGIAGSWTMLIVSGLGVAGIGAAVAWIFCYDHSDRSEIRSVLSTINALQFIRPQVTNASS